jgi:hypothetical protein
VATPENKLLTRFGASAALRNRGSFRPNLDAGPLVSSRASVQVTRIVVEKSSRYKAGKVEVGNGWIERWALHVPGREAHNFDTTTPHGQLMLTVLGGLAEFERSATPRSPCGLVMGASFRSVGDGIF